MSDSTTPEAGFPSADKWTDGTFHADFPVEALRSKPYKSTRFNTEDEAYEFAWKLIDSNIPKHTIELLQDKINGVVTGTRVAVAEEGFEELAKLMPPAPAKEIAPKEEKPVLGEWLPGKDNGKTITFASEDDAQALAWKLIDAGIPESSIALDQHLETAHAGTPDEKVTVTGTSVTVAAEQLAALDAFLAAPAAEQPREFGQWKDKDKGKTITFASEDDAHALAWKLIDAGVPESSITLDQHRETADSGTAQEKVTITGTSLNVSAEGLAALEDYLEPATPVKPMVESPPPAVTVQHGITHGAAASYTTVQPAPAAVAQPPKPPVIAPHPNRPMAKPIAPPSNPALRRPPGAPPVAPPRVTGHSSLAQEPIPTAIPVIVEQAPAAQPPAAPKRWTPPAPKVSPAGVPQKPVMRGPGQLPKRPEPRTPQPVVAETTRTPASHEDVRLGLSEQLGIPEDHVSVYSRDGQVRGYLIKADDDMAALALVHAFNQASRGQPLATRGEVKNGVFAFPQRDTGTFYPKEPDPALATVFVRAGGELAYNETAGNFLRSVGDKLSSGIASAAAAYPPERSR